jgi:hypothetical protein
LTRRTVFGTQFSVQFGGQIDTYDRGYSGHLTDRGGLRILDQHKRIAAFYPAASWTILVGA